MASFFSSHRVNRGFTLIELLVVIAIIGVLSSIVMASIENARSKARDTKRIREIKSLMTALELYRETNGFFPISGNCGANSPNTGWCNSVQSLSNGRWIRNGTSDLSGFIGSDPIDPTQGSTPKWTPVDGGGYFYYSNNYGGSGRWYMIVYGLENPNPALERTDGVTACNGQYFHYGNGSNGVLTVGSNCY